MVGLSLQSLVWSYLVVLATVPHRDVHIHGSKKYSTRMYMYTTARSEALECTCARQQEVKHEDVHVHHRKKQSTKMYMNTTVRSKAPGCTCTRQQAVKHGRYMYTTTRSKAPECSCRRLQEVKHQDVNVHDSKK